MYKRSEYDPRALSEERSETRDLNDPARLADEAKAQMEKQAADLRAAKVPTPTEPPTVYRP